MEKVNHHVPSLDLLKALSVEYENIGYIRTQEHAHYLPLLQLDTGVFAAIPDINEPFQNLIQVQLGVFIHYYGVSWRGERFPVFDVITNLPVQFVRGHNLYVRVIPP